MSIPHTCADNPDLPCPACIQIGHAFTEQRSDHRICINCYLSDTYVKATGTRCKLEDQNKIPNSV